MVAPTEAAVIREAARPEFRPREAVRAAWVTLARDGIPHAAVVGRDARRLVERPNDLARIGAEVDVVPEITVREHVEDARADDAREEHREAEIDDHVGIAADALGPNRARGGREEKPREQEDEVAGEPDAEEPEELGAHPA